MLYFSARGGICSVPLFSPSGIVSWVVFARLMDVLLHVGTFFNIPDFHPLEDLLLLPVRFPTFSKNEAKTQMECLGGIVTLYTGSQRAW